MSAKRLTQKQETFCLKYFELGNATEAAIGAGYSRRSIRNIASVNLTKANIQIRLQQLRQKVEDASIMNVLERKQRLTEVARAKLTDFMELGQDGSWVNLGAETPLSGAIQEIHSRTEYDKDGSKPTIHTSVKLHDPIKAIDLLNKMDKIYSETPAGNTYNIGAMQVNIGDPKEKLISAISRLAARGSEIKAITEP